MFLEFGYEAGAMSEVARRIGGSKERVQDLAGPPAIGEQFSVVLLVEWNVEFAEEI